MFVPSVSLDGALASARRERIRLLSRIRKLLGGSVVGAALVLAYLVAAILQPFAAGRLRLGLEVGLALGASGGLLLLALRTRATLLRTTEDVRLLELARDASEREDAPRVEVHPYRGKGGGPALVVRTDAAFRPEREREPLSPVARAAAGLLVASLAALVAAFLLGEGPRAQRRWTFADAHASLDAAGLRAGDPRSGPWTLEEDDRATGARAVVNRAGEGDAPAATLLATGLRARDVRVLTRCRVRPARSPDADASCGLVLRHDGGDHVSARFDAAAGRVVLASVIAGRETVLGVVPATVGASAWQEIAASARGDVFVVWWNGRRVLEARVPRAPRVGDVGLWAPASAEAAFDELLVETLPASVLSS